MPSKELSVDERFELLRSVGEECIRDEELRNLIEKKPNIRCYDGFEPSGRMHIAQGIFKAVSVNKCTESGCEFVFWVADWFALMNDKVGGELEKIGNVGKYLIEVWKAAGMDMEKVIFLWSSEEITKHAETYWKTVLDIGRKNTIARIKKCCTIMGKTEGTLTAAQVLYPLMQCSDIFFLKADICQLGLDQRKVNMLAREYCDLIGKKLKPVILSHHMLAGLKKGQAKMSKSDPDSAIFMEDTEEDVIRKISQAYCPRAAQAQNIITEDGAPEITDAKNPVLDYYQCIIFSRKESSVTIGEVTYCTYEDLEAAFLEEKISEQELKNALIHEINALLEPVRKHFKTCTVAHELLELVKSYRKDGAAPPLAEQTVTPVPERPHAVMWLPARIKIPLDTASAMVRAAKKFLAENENARISLVLPDWTANAYDDITGDDKDIGAALQMNYMLLKAAGLPDAVELVKENDLMLADKNNYWVTVINVGRKVSLTRIEEIYGDDLKHAGQVIGSLMRVANALLLNATHVIGTSFDVKTHVLISEYTKDAMKCLATDEGLLPPLCRPDTTVPVSADDVLYLDDNDMELRKKIKKAYCAPNESSNPVITVGLFIMKESQELKIERGEANGGDIAYTSPEKLRADCESGALHPADLKAAVSKYLVDASAATRELLKNPDVKKHSTVLRNAEKKLAKKK